MEDLEDAPIFQRPKKFRPNWQEFNRPLSPSEKFILSRIEPQSSITPSCSDSFGTELSPIIKNDSRA